MANKLRKLLTNIRFYVLTGSILLSGIIATLVWLILPPGELQLFRLSQVYALLAMLYLYVAILAGPLTKTFPGIPLKATYLKSRRAIGVSAFYYALLHSLLAFFGALGGLNGISFLSNRYLLASLFGAIALIILFLMAITSFDWVVRQLTFKWWKRLHRLVYIAAILTLSHGLILGTHFSDLSNVISRVSFVAIMFLLILESLRLDRYLVSRFPKLEKIGVATMVVLHTVFLGVGYVIGTRNSSVGIPGLGVHAQHIQLAQQAQQAANTPSSQIPSLNGDKSKRYTVSFEHPDTVNPNEPTGLGFRVYDASSGNPASSFVTLYDKPAHLVIVDQSLDYYQHVHPQPTDNNFQISTTFPHPGRYHLYLNFQPTGAIEQQFGFSLDVGTSVAGITANQSVSSDLTKLVEGYQVTMGTNQLSASSLSFGQQKLDFTVKTASGQPVTTLKPYLAAFGHLVMIDEQTYDYLHVHPTNATPPAANASSGPKIEFLPLGLYGPIKPGVYRVFVQLNPDNHLITADFTIKLN